MMKFLKFRILPATAFLLTTAHLAHAITPAELESRFKQLPTVPEDKMPPLSNSPGTFRGLIEHEGLEGHTWVAFPFVENPGSFCFDAQGRLFVAEANRFWLGVPDLRGANELIRDDFKALKLEDRTALYQKYASSFPEGWFSKVADRVIQLEDRDGNGAADFRSLFSDRFSEPLDGIGFSLLADDGSVYFTCIPNLWKLTDTDHDGVADEEKVISSGYGVRVSFIGHDLHGITRGPDGRLYFSVGDRSYDIETSDGKSHQGDGKGAIFRCESDGSGLEIFCDGLRNPQELAFDNFGNLFTFDNTGDIGDLARMVYALEGTNSGWNMSHQAAHHYATHLDWGDFRPELSMWVKERMFDLYNEEQPQWVYPPASHVARGPSGVTYLTGNSLPQDLRDHFLLANYRGPSEGCTVLTVKVEPSGAGYVATSEKELFKGIGVSDVELGFDGKIYLCDFGGGWSVNEKGSIQVASSTNPDEKKAGEQVAALFKGGFSQRKPAELQALLRYADRRVRQAAQFALVDQGEAGMTVLKEVATTPGDLFPRLHAIWGIGQAGRRGGTVSGTLLPLLDDSDPEIRANAARVLGEIRSLDAKTALLTKLRDDSLRVRSLAAIALGRISEEGAADVTEALFQAALTNGQSNPDIVLRHSLLSALKDVATVKAAVARKDSASKEERLIAVLVLRHHESPELAAFLEDSEPLIQREVIRAIYDTAALDSPAGDRLAALGDKAANFPEAIQRRIVAANYRRGKPANAVAMLAVASNPKFEMPVRKAALNGLKGWENTIETDPVLGRYRPQANTKGRTFDDISAAIGDPLRDFLTGPHSPELITLGMELATAAKVDLDPAMLMAQVKNTKLTGDLRVAILESLSESKPDGLNEIVSELLSDQDTSLRAAAMKEAFVLGLPGIAEKGKAAIKEAKLPVARAALSGIAAGDPDTVLALWDKRESDLRKGLWLDAYLALSERNHVAAASYAASDPQSVYHLSIEGGDAAAGEIVFKNQGACLQCHKVGGEGGDKGGVQGPDLRQVANRLPREKILESVANPGAVIAPGFGMTSVMLKSGDTVVGRLSEEKDNHVTVIGLDNSERKIGREEIASIAPPVSAMPPMAAALPPRDFRNLIAFLASQNGGKKGKDDSSHGDDEKIAK